ncbi:MAG: monovalent cation/H(+) antiporter subunit G [Gemmatimonadota bacterium]
MNVLAILFGLLGAFFFLAGTVGLLRLPDFYSRAHAAAKCDTVGAGSILLALAFDLGPGLASLKLAGLVLLILVAGPTASHALARAAHRRGISHWTREDA